MYYRGSSVRPVLLSLVLVLSIGVAGGVAAAERAGHASAEAENQQATRVTSCTTIDEPGRYRLVENLTVEDTGECIRIVADDVVFDGGGHRLVGGESRTERGILVRNASNVTVRDVSVSGMVWAVTLWDTESVTVRRAEVNGNLRGGIWVLESRNATLENLTARGNAFNGVRFHSARDSRLTASTLSNNGIGVSVGRSAAIAVRDVTLVNNQLGMQVMTTSGSRFSDSRIENNRIGIVLALATGNTVEGNRITGGEDGIRMDGADDNLITDNRISGVDFGIYLQDSVSNRIEGNTISAAEAGIEFTLNSDRNHAVNNTLDADRVGVEVTWSANNTIRGNRIRAAASVTLAGSGRNTVAENSFERTDAPTPTSTPTPMTTPTAGSSTPATTEPTERASPGLGPAVGVVALLLLTLLARRSDE